MVEQVDTLVLGAGLSGVAAGYYLQKECPGTSYAILEMRDEVGGTWSLFKYPGIRSDSDMATFGYPFRPWPKAESLGEGPEIRQYIEDTAKEFGIFEKIRFRHKVISANWSPEKARWEVVARRLDTDEEVELEAKFLLSCMGYYDYDEGYTPEFPGRERFKGTFVHPQHWPEDLDYTGKRVVVIGSGATAVTLIPAMADKVEKITMLQRSPSYVFSIPARDKIAELFQRVLPEHYAAEAKRWKNVLLTQGFYEYCQAFPDRARKLLMDGVRKKVGDGFDVDTHFNPRYNPWDQRLCAVPASDLFKAIRSGKADVITDTIETFTEDGIHLSGGGDLKADIIPEVTGEAGGGLARVTMDGRHAVKKVQIDPSLVEDVEMLEDIVTAAINDAVNRISEANEERMSNITSGLPLPPGFKMPF